MHLNFVCFTILGVIGDAPVILAKPQTFMNSSGESVSMLGRESLYVIISVSNVHGREYWFYDCEYHES